MKIYSYFGLRCAETFQDNYRLRGFLGQCFSQKKLLKLEKSVGEKEGT